MKLIQFGIIILTLLIASCQSNKNEQVNKNNVEETKKPKLDIRYSENLETLALIYNLSESGDYHFNEIIGPRGTLAKELTIQFEEYRDHEAVQKLNKLLDDGFVDTYDVILSLYNTNLPEYVQFAKYPSIYYENEGLTAKETQAIFDDFNTSVIHFYKDANLKKRFENNYKGLYEKIMEEVHSVAPTEKFIEEAEAYYGIERDSYEIIISAFSFNGIGRAKLINGNGKTKAISLVTSNHLVESDSINLNNLNSFTVGYNDEKYFQEVGLHELIHTFFHEALKENKENIALINELDYLFTDSLKNDMIKQGYVDWRTCFEEHLVRLGEIKIAELIGNNDFCERYMNECIADKGFIYMELMQEILLEYENNRDKYKTIGSFIPYLLHELNKKIPNKEFGTYN